ncbi:MAG: hypothetical protein NT007_09560 [Candidatus Kapabacteria bacterium]|nr:hypothetical protein [Candidatus Kapabacteria bacterium]
MDLLTLSASLTPILTKAATGDVASKQQVLDLYNANKNNLSAADLSTLNSVINASGLFETDPVTGALKIKGAASTEEGLPAWAYLLGGGLVIYFLFIK